MRNLPDRPGRPNPYGVQWRERRFDEKIQRERSFPKSLYFPTTEARDAYAAEKRKTRRAGMLVVSVDRREIEDFRAFKASTEGAPWQNVVAGWRAHLMSTGHSVCTIKIEVGVKEYLAECQAWVMAEKMAPGTLTQKKQKLNLFAEQFGHLMLDQVPGGEIEDWIEDFDEVQSDGTFDNYRKHVSAFYGYYIGKKAIRENPCRDVKTRWDEISEVQIISVAQTAQLFHTALTYRDSEGTLIFKPAIGRLALEAFWGLRFSSGCRVEKKDINFEDRGILHPKKKLKTRRRHYVDGLPPQAWKWLAIMPEEGWHLEARQYLELKSRLFHVANVPHPRNCLRHNFCTYHIAAFKNPGRTAVILCHRDQEELWDHYFGNATEQEGKRYQTITPRNAAALAKGFEPRPTPTDAPQPVPA